MSDRSQCNWKHRCKALNPKHKRACNSKHKWDSPKDSVTRSTNDASQSYTSVIQNSVTNLNLSMKQGSLFVLFVLMRSTELGCFSSWSLWKALEEEGCIGLVWTCGVEVLDYWMISSLKIKLNHSWKYRRNWNVPLVLLERSWWAGFNWKISWERGNTWANGTGHTSI